MAQHGQVLRLKTRGADGKSTWAYRYRVDGRCSARPQVGGFETQGEAVQALEVALERLRARSRSCAGSWRKRRVLSAVAAWSTCGRMRSALGGRCSPRGIASRRPRLYDSY